MRHPEIPAVLIFMSMEALASDQVDAVLTGSRSVKQFLFPSPIGRGIPGATPSGLKFNAI
jgi:hypothetical protein